MILSKLQIGGITAAVGAITVGFVWASIENRHLHSEVTRRSTLAIESRSSLERAVGVQSQRLAAAETKVATLLEAVKLDGAVRATSPARTGLTMDADTAVKDE
eukprot:gene17767-21734_t